MSRFLTRSKFFKAGRLFVQILCLMMIGSCTTLEEAAFVPLQKVDPTEAMRLVQHYAVKLKYDKKLFLKDSVLFYEERINRLRLDFETEMIVGICEARTLLVDVVEELLRRINMNDRVSSQFSQIPITAENLEIYIDFHSFYGTYNDPLVIGAVSLRGGISYFFAADLKDVMSDVWHDRQEFYFQSRNIVQFQREGEDLYKPKEKDLVTLENELLNFR